ncbi:MAG: ion transporter [Bacteroidia bacterium]
MQEASTNKFDTNSKNLAHNREHLRHSYKDRKIQYRTDKEGQYHKLKQQVHSLLYPGDDSTFWSRLINSFIATLIILTVVAVVLETDQYLNENYHAEFIKIEVFAIIIFTVEYILRVWSSTSVENYKHPIKGRLRYMFSMGSLIDLLAILPFYLPLILGMDLRFIMSLRMLRFFRLFKLGRYMHASIILERVLIKRKEELILSLSITLFLILMASSFMFFIEHDAQPEVFSSIPHAMWWAVSTLTTVGYGDIIPITPLGKFLGGIISILGLGLIALPTGILVSGFTSEFNQQNKSTEICPHCGKSLNNQE